MAADAPGAAKAEKPKKEKRVCKSFPSSNSRMGSYVCKTPTEWERDGEAGSHLSAQIRSERPNP